MIPTFGDFIKKAKMEMGDKETFIIQGKEPLVWQVIERYVEMNHRLNLMTEVVRSLIEYIRDKDLKEVKRNGKDKKRK